MPSTPPAPARHIGLEGAVNFRDLGGYPAADGRRTRWRTLFRADGLSRLTSADRDVVRNLGVATVIDLRSTLEMVTGRFPTDELAVDFHHLPLLDTLPDPDRFQLAPGLLAVHYEEIARDGAARIATALGIIAEQRCHPVVVHCTAGKDRTGVLMAVLLSLLGVPDDVVVEDYALSGQAMGALRQRLVSRHPALAGLIEQATELFSAAPENIARLLATLRAEHGSVEAYAAEAGAGPEVVAGLRRALLE